MKIISNKTYKILNRIVKILTNGYIQSPPPTFNDLVNEAEFMLNYKNNKNKFIEDCLDKRKNKCMHNKHVGLRYFGCAWHMFCFECGESRFCAIQDGYSSGNPSMEYLKSLAKKVEFM